VTWPFGSLEGSQPIASALLLALVVIAGASDLHTRRLPNWLTLGGAVAGLICQTWPRGGPGALDSSLGWLLGCALLFVPFRLRGVGAGDVKLLGAVGAIRGPGFVFAAFFCTALIGGLISLLVMARYGTLVPAVRRLGADLIYLALAVFRYRVIPVFATPLPTAMEARGAAGGTPRITYGVAIAAGTLVAMALGY
jgi:prepilin peptidase CpaA